MDITARIEMIINDLNAAKEDALKVDKGQAGAPGTRLRKAATQAGKDLAEVRKAVLEARNAD